MNPPPDIRNDVMTGDVLRAFRDPQFDCGLTDQEILAIVRFIYNQPGADLVRRSLRELLGMRVDETLEDAVARRFSYLVVENKNQH